MKHVARRTRSATVQVIAGNRLRACATCGEWLPEDEVWYRWRGHLASWNNECRECENARRRAFYRRQREAA